MPADTTVPVSDEVWSELMARKERGDTFDDVLRRVLDLDADAASDAPDDDLAAAIDAWVPDGDVATQTARDAVRDAVAFLYEYEDRATKSDIVGAAKPADVSEQQWWDRGAQPGLAMLAERGLVDRPTSKTYAMEG